MADITPQEAAALLPVMKSLTKAMGDSSRIAQSIFLATQNTSRAAIGELQIRKEVLSNYQSEYAALTKMKKMGEDIYQTELKRLKSLVDLDVKLEGQEATLKNINRENEKSLQIEKNKIDIMAKQGKMFTSYLAQKALDAKNAFRTESGHVTGTSIAQGFGHTGAGIANIAQDPASMLSALGPWGVILKMIVDIIDGLRAMTSTMSQANAASGNFIKGFKSAGDEAAQIMSQQTEMMYNYGFTTEEVGEIYKGLKDTGLQALGTIPKTGSAMSGVADSVFAFAKATGQTYDQVSTQFAELTRTNGVATSEIRKSYMEVFNVAEKAGQAGVASATQVMQSIFAMDQQFASVGANVKGISDIVSGLTDILSSSKIAGGIEQLNKVSQGIIGISSASDGMLVMLGKMGGMSGTFSQVWEKMKGINPTTGYIEKGAQPIQQNLMMFGSLMDKISTMAGGGSQGRYTADTFAQKNFGMDINTTQAARDLYAKMKNAAPGSMDQKQAQKKFEDMLATAKKTQLDSKGMFEILKNILVGLIAKPIIAIWGIATKFGGDKAAQQRYATGVDNIIKKKTDNGMNFLLDDQISKAATARKKAGVHFGANGQVVVHNNVTANGQLSPAQIAAAGKAAQQGTVQLLQKQQKANTGSH